MLIKIVISGQGSTSMKILKHIDNKTLHMRSVAGFGYVTSKIYLFLIIFNKSLISLIESPIKNKSRVTSTKANSFTPDQKLSVQLSSTNKRDSDQLGYSKYTKATGRSDLEGNDTFITQTDYHHHFQAMDERINKLENLVWSLYKELNGKIENTNANLQLQLVETNNTTNQVFTQLGEEIGSLREDMGQITYPLRKFDDDGYEGSAEEFYHNEGEGEEENFLVGSLDKVDEELHSNDYSNEGKDEFSRQSVDKTDLLVESSLDKVPQSVQDSGKDLEDQQKFRFEQNYSSPHFWVDQKGPSTEGNKESTSPAEESEEEEGDLEYYFSCHERMIRDYNKGTHQLFKFIDSGYMSNISDIFKGNKDELKENFSAPDLSRSTLVDQIDYDLDDYKINESSVFNSWSSDSAYASNQPINCSSLNENRLNCANVAPRLMGFLNTEKVLGKIPVKDVRK
jgi:hypothetical protein